MSTVNHRLIKVILVLVFSFSSYADFSSKQVRYLSVKDIQLTLKRIFPRAQADCLTESPKTSSAFGYSSPVTGKPVSKKPNFNFINSYMQCVKSLLQMASNDTIVPEGSGLYSYGFYVDADQVALRKAVKDHINKLVGPEAVIKSYGFLASEDEFVELIMNTVKESDSVKTVLDFMRESIYFISLRDEFLSY